jgi:hypothetical protein
LEIRHSERLADGRHVALAAKLDGPQLVDDDDRAEPRRRRAENRVSGRPEEWRIMHPNDDLKRLET